MFDFENRVLAELATDTNKATPIQIENILIKNPNDIDDWIAAAISAPRGLQEKVFAQAIRYGNSLPEAYRQDFMSALERVIIEEYGDILKSLKQSKLVVGTTDSSSPESKSEPLSEDKIKYISNQAQLRKRMLSHIDDLIAFKDLPATGGFMGEMASNAKEKLPTLLLEYKKQFDEEYPEGDDLPLAVRAIPHAIGNRFDAHGIAKGNNLESLINLLINGVDLDRPFHTMPFVANAELAALGAVSPYTDGGIIVVGPVNEQDDTDRKLIVDREKEITNIDYVVLDREYYFAIPALQKAFPTVTFVKASETNDFFTEVVRTKDSSKNTL